MTLRIYSENIPGLSHIYLSLYTQENKYMYTCVHTPQERAGLEKKLELKSEQLQRSNDLRDTGVAQLQETKEASLP